MSNKQFSNILNEYSQDLEAKSSEYKQKRQLCLGEGKEVLNGTVVEKLKSMQFTNTPTIKKFEEATNNAGKAITTSEILTKIEKDFGKKCITYKQLVDLCKKYDLFFGPAEFFNKTLPESAIVDLVNLPHDKLRSNYTVIHSYDGCSLLKRSSSSSFQCIVAASLNSFSFLPEDNKSFIRSKSRELIPICRNLIKFPTMFYKSSISPIVLVPFKINGVEGEIFFTIITNWYDE